jgi:hypothetical protein
MENAQSSVEVGSSRDVGDVLLLTFSATVFRLRDKSVPSQPGTKKHVFLVPGDSTLTTTRTGNLPAAHRGATPHLTPATEFNSYTVRYLGPSV